MVIADTGYWIALANRNDRFHQKALDVSIELLEDPITTWPVMTETCHLLQNRVGHQSVSLFLDSIEHTDIAIFDIQMQHLSRIKELMVKYAALPMDLADASLVILAEELGHGRILSTDRRDFNTYRWKNRDPFQNLLLGDG